MAATAKKSATPKPELGFSITMDLSKSTKGTHVFTNDGDSAPITTLYIQRSAFQGDPPETITVSVEESAAG